MAIILKIFSFPVLVYQFNTFPIKMPIRLHEIWNTKSKIGKEVKRYKNNQYNFGI